MNIKWIGKEALLTVLASFPVGASIARQWDSITTSLKFKSIEADIEKLFTAVNDDPQIPLQNAVVEIAKLIGAVGLVPEKTFVKLQECMAIMQILSRESKLGCANDPFLDIERCLDTFKGISKETDLMRELRLVTYELEQEELIYRHADANSPVGFHQISPKEYFFCRTDRLFQSWNPMQDADEVVQYMINQKMEMAGLQELDQFFKWGPRRLNSAVAELYLSNMIDDSHDLGDAIVTGYVLSWIRLTEAAYLQKSI